MFNSGSKAKKAPSVKIPKWNALVVEQPGEKAKKIKIEAASRASARLAIASKGFELLELSEVQPLITMELGKAVPKKELLQFTRQIAAFTTAGISIIDALQMLGGNSKNTRLKKTLASMVNDIRDGDTLAKSAASHPEVFPDYYIAILQAADRSGDLTATFETLANYLERDLTSARAVKSAMYYPATLFVLGIAAVFILAVVVLPKFETFFASLDVELPPATAFLLNSSRFIAQWWPIILGVLLTFVAIFYLYRKSPKGALATDTFVLKVPIFGPLLRLIALERFCRILGSLVETGVPLSDGLDLSSTVTGNKAFEQAAIKTRQGVNRGEGLSSPMEETKVFPQEVIQIFRVGEESGRLDKQLEHAARYYAAEVDYKLKNLTALIEPVVLLVIGGGVGFIAVALVSAMYGIYSSSSLGA